MEIRIKAKKEFGQNFLVDDNVLNRIVSCVAPGSDDCILEVGPGRGALSRLLVASGARFVAVEWDRELIPFLHAEFAGNDRVEIGHGDILRVDLHQILTSRAPGRKWKVAANLPYNISSQVLFKFMEQCDLFESLVLMLQKEVGDRLTAPPACKEYGALTVLLRLHFDIRREFIVKPGSFRPVPKVDSAVLSFTPLPGPRVEVGDEELFRRLVKGAFNQRRKTLLNSLRSAGFDDGDGSLSLALSRCGIDGLRRGETLSLDEFAALSRDLCAGKSLA
ncbi:16S rRNA (adenine(1518)-N(6)/adenine(1519)-N(6))-dimethyltransferase RsmA [Geomonas subterranea]|uniref:Ribosomal RNA small subunit methyltransferase A n=1 Tax=Geomonas subterranea TaxID=2847989 RepID=A0ABX8LQR3_9BACT|nr:MULTISPECIES: 16S rRNA (adenine(1518)-N(6)/adenine(1519)-N(6))-dimethyltransferase RsmA [Geomonas]QXE91860.1 16S rRNA (adenine(1518)-N(6)/adenine(1519)-N(6))-dimethyltransferase RsmA [Geomonas subterranea]QXM10048.1 16S rRNA (adenine(1518)-N(6)/adenine(1519)-N(6))-dimethyltransferase RsmA [Geomonas subterranea]